MLRALNNYKKQYNILLMLFLSLLMTSCFFNFASESSGVGSVLPEWTPEQNSLSQNFFEETLQAKLSSAETNCNSCHGTVQYPLFATTNFRSNHDFMLDLDLINLSNPATSKIYLKIKGGHQGFSQEVADDILASINSWIERLDLAGIPIELDPSDDSGPPEDPVQSFQALSSFSAIKKVKRLLVSEGLTESEIALMFPDNNFTSSAFDKNKLRTLIDGWVDSPVFERKLRDFFQITLQQKGPNISQAANRTEVIGSIGFINRTGKTAADRVDASRLLNQFYENVEESIARTAVDIVKKNEPFSDITNTNSWMMTTGLLSHLAYYENRRVGEGIFEESLTAGATANRAFAFLMIDREFTESDFNDWRRVSFTKAANIVDPEPFYNVAYYRDLTAGSSTDYGTSHIGFFSSPGFKLVWDTNLDNQFRVTINQTLLTALGETFETGDTTVQTVFDNIPLTHAEETTSCYKCHRLMDPMRNIFQNNFGFDYQVDTRSSFESSFSFRGMSRPMNTIEDLGLALKEHSLFATAWTQKVCTHFNSLPCVKDDPELLRVAGLFEDSNYNFKTLVKELMLSPLVLANTETPTSKLSSELISISRRNQFCSNLNVGIINLATNSGGDIPEFDNGESVCAVGNSVLGASVLPIENFVRGVENDSLPPTSSAVWSMGIERICKQTATTYVNTNALVKATDELSFSINQILTDFLGVPSNHPLYANFSSAMTELYNSARDDGLGNVLARREMFSFVCESPELIGVGL